MANTKPSNRWLVLAVICFGGGIIYILPYIQYSFYDQLQEAFGLSNLQMGNLMSSFGTASAVAYLVGGVLADRFSVRKLVTLSLATTGLAGIWFTTFPSYSVLMTIMMIFAVSTVLAYWPAMIKAVKLLASDDEQGRMFGLREAGFGIFSFVFTQLGTWLIYSRNPGVPGVRNLLLFYCGIYFVAAVLSWIYIPDSKREDHTQARSTQELLQGVVAVAKRPVVWIIGLVVFCAYTISGAGFGSKFVPYLTNIGGMDSAVAASLASARMYLLPVIAATIAGIIVDRIGSAARFLKWAYVGLILGLLGFIFTPTSGSLVPVVVVGFTLSFVIYCMRGTYFVPLAQSGIPDYQLGTAAGLVSFIGYLPDAFMFTVFGKMMGDAPGVSEFRNILWVNVGLAVAGFLLSWWLQSITRKVVAPAPATTSVEV